MLTGGRTIRAFNAGADARLRGLSRATNPYAGKEEEVEQTAWLRGWWHADQFWGTDAKWPVAVLPAVMGVAS